MVEAITVWRNADLAGLTRRPADLKDEETGGRLYEAWLIGMQPLTNAVLYVNIKAGQRTGPHLHSIGSHFACVVRGTALVWVEGEMNRIETGECYTIPPNVLHEVGADAREDAWIVESTSPLQEVPQRETIRQDEARQREPEIAAAFAAAQSKSPAPA